MPAPSTLLRRLLVGVALAVATTAVSPLHAQRLGLEVGMAGAENQETSLGLGATLSLPLTSNLKLSGSYLRWTACDEVECGVRGYGNEGAHALALFRLAGGPSLGASLGAGVSWYERVFDVLGEEDKSWEQALTVAGELRRAVAYNSDVYLRGEMSFPDDDTTPRWGFLRLGVDVGVF